MRIIAKTQEKETIPFTLRLDESIHDWLDGVCKEYRQKTGKFLAKQKLIMAILKGAENSSDRAFVVEID